MTTIVRAPVLACPVFPVFAQRAAYPCVVDGRTTCRQRRWAGDPTPRAIGRSGLLADAPNHVRVAPTEMRAGTGPMVRASTRSFAADRARERDGRSCGGGFGARARDAR